MCGMQTKKETTVVIERKGEDAARLSTTCDLHGYVFLAHIHASIFTTEVFVS